MTTPDTSVRPTVPVTVELTYLEERRRAEAHERTRLADALRRETERRLEDGDTRRLRDAHLGCPMPDQVRQHHDALAERVRGETRRGATVHRRLPVVVRQVPWAVALLDGLVLFTFCAAIFNVALDDPFTLEGAVAAMLALLGSGIAYTWLALTGSRLRCYRTHLGDVAWRTTGLLTRIMLGITSVVVIALAALMYVRVVGDAGAAADADYLAHSAVPVLGVVFAVISAAANLAVVAVHALDGSDIALEMRHAGRVLHRRQRVLERARRRAWRRVTRRSGGN